MTHMTSRERIHAAMTGGEPDKVPVCPKLSVYLLDKYGSNSLEAHLRYKQLADYDVLFPVGSMIPMPIESATTELPYTKDAVCHTDTWTEGDLTCVRRTFKTPAGTLTDITKIPPRGDKRYGVQPNPFKTEWLIKDRSDLDRLAYILPDPEKTCNSDRYHEINRTLGDDGLAELIIRGAVDKRAGDARGMDNLMMDYYDDRDFFNETLKFFMRYVTADTKAYLEAGVKHIFGTWFYTSLSSGWSPAMFRECFVPLIKEHIDLVHSYGAVYDLYDDGKMSLVLEDYAAAGADVIQTLTPPPVGDVVLADAKKRVGDRVCLLGHVDLIYVMLLGSAHDVEEAVKNAIQTAGPGGRFILSNTDSIREGTPDENMAAYFSAAKKYRDYPIRA